eukprot:1300098-Alexandrium_andersonii.AAC.1
MPDALAPPSVSQTVEGLLTLLLGTAAGGVTDRAAGEPPPASTEGRDTQSPQRVAQTGDRRRAIPLAELRLCGR